MDSCMAGDHCEPDMTIADQVRTSLVLTAAFTGLLRRTMTRLYTAPGASSNSNPAMSSVSHSPSSSPEPLRTTSKDDKKAGKDENSCESNCGCGSDSSENDTSKKDKK